MSIEEEAGEEGFKRMLHGILKQVVVFFYPGRRKLLACLLYPYALSLGIAVFFLLITLGLGGIGPGDLRGLGEAVQGTTFYEVLYWVLRFLVYSIVSYPLICAFFAFHRVYKRGGFRGFLGVKTTFLLILLGVVVSNPLMAYFTSGMLGLGVDLLVHPRMEGVVIVDIAPESPARYREACFGHRVYYVEILRGGESVYEKRVRDTEDFHEALENVRQGDWVRLYGVAGIPCRFQAEENLNLTDLGIRVQNSGEAPLRMIEVVRINPDSPLARTTLKPGYKIYEIEVYKMTWIKIDELTEKQSRINFRRFRVEDTEDFYEALNSAKVGERVKFMTVSVEGTQPSFKLMRNITDWGIEVKNVELWL